MSFSRDYASKGYEVADDTNAHEVSFFGITVLEAAVISAISAPTGQGPENTSYNGDEAGIAGPTLPAGVFLPIRGSSITLASGKVIVWFE
jgi:hypothetical protein